MWGASRGHLCGSPAFLYDYSMTPTSGAGSKPCMTQLKPSIVAADDGYSFRAIGTKAHDSSGPASRKNFLKAAVDLWRCI